MKAKKKIVIVGAGISGLSAAYYLRHHDVIVLEKSHRAGGWIASDSWDGYVFERGPRTFRLSGSDALLSLIQELGLEIVTSAKEAHRRYLFSGGKLRPLSFWKHIPVLLREAFIPPGSLEDETIFDFAKRRWNEKIAHQFFDPMTLGIYAGDIKKLSMRSCFPLLWEWEKKKGSVIMGALGQKKGGLFAIKGGNERLIEALLPHCNVRYNEEVVDIDEVKKKYQADHVFIATPAHVAARLVPNLDKIESVSLTVVHLHYAQKVLHKKGFGYLVPSSEGEKVLGMVWDSVIFPGKGTHVTVMLKEENKELALDAMRRHLGIVAKPDHMDVTVANHCIPQYALGHSQAMQRSFPGITLLGNYIEGVSVNACISRAKNSAHL